MKKLCLVFVCLAFLACLNGCMTATTEETADYFIFGFGRISVKKVDCATVVDTHALGLYVSDGPSLKTNLGYVSELTSFLDPDSNVLLEIRENPYIDGGIEIGVTKAEVKNNVPKMRIETLREKLTNKGEEK